MDFEISVDGDVRLDRGLGNFADRIEDWREAWPEVNKGFENLERRSIRIRRRKGRAWALGGIKYEI